MKNILFRFDRQKSWHINIMGVYVQYSEIENILLLYIHKPALTDLQRHSFIK